VWLRVKYYQTTRLPSKWRWYGDPSPPNYFMVSDLCFFITKIYFDCHINLVHESPPNIHLHIFFLKKVIYSHDKFRIATEKHVNKQIYPNSQPTKTSLCSHSDFGWCAGDTSHNHQNDMFCSPRWMTFRGSHLTVPLEKQDGHVGVGTANGHNRISIVECYYYGHHMIFWRH
jgi:hypothetical protein